MTSEASLVELSEEARGIRHESCGLLQGISCICLLAELAFVANDFMDTLLTDDIHDLRFSP